MCCYVPKTLNAAECNGMICKYLSWQMNERGKPACIEALHVRCGSTNFVCVLILLNSEKVPVLIYRCLNKNAMKALAQSQMLISGKHWFLFVFFFLTQARYLLSPHYFTTYQCQQLHFQTIPLRPERLNDFLKATMEQFMTDQGLNLSFEQGVKQQQPDPFITSKFLILSIQWLVSADPLTPTIQEEGQVPCAVLYN